MAAASVFASILACIQLASCILSRSRALSRPLPSSQPRINSPRKSGKLPEGYATASFRIFRLIKGRAIAFQPALGRGCLRPRLRNADWKVAIDIGSFKVLRVGMRGGQMCGQQAIRIPVLDRRELLDYVECVQMDR